MIKDRLKSFDYYLKKLPLYMLNSYGISAQFHIIFEMLLEMDKTEDDILKAVNILDSNYLDYINNIDGTYKPNSSDILDKIAAIYGYTRTFNVAYLDENNQPVSAELNLNNEELLMLIKAAIIQFNFDGSREMQESYYKSIGLPIYTMTDMLSTATCNVTLNTGEMDVSTNLEHLFRAGLLNIKSAGIKYVYRVANIASLLIWDDDREAVSWDNGYWA